MKCEVPWLPGAAGSTVWPHRRDQATSRGIAGCVLLSRWVLGSNPRRPTKFPRKKGLLVPLPVLPAIGVISPPRARASSAGGRSTDRVHQPRRFFTSAFRLAGIGRQAQCLACFKCHSTRAARFAPRGIGFAACQTRFSLGFAPLVIAMPRRTACGSAAVVVRSPSGSESPERYASTPGRQGSVAESVLSVCSAVPGVPRIDDP